MKISWTNLHYFVLGAVTLNFVVLYALSANQISKESVVAKNPSSLPSPTKFIKSNDTQTHSIYSPFHAQAIDPISNNSDSSVAEEIGKSISSGTKPYPIPVIGAMQKLIEVTKEEAEAFFPKENKPKAGQIMMMYLIVIIVLCVIALFFYEVLIKTKERNAAVLDSNNANDKYILLDAEAD